VRTGRVLPLSHDQSAALGWSLFFHRATIKFCFVSSARIRSFRRKSAYGEDLGGVLLPLKPIID
jgi:hypothetical protein